MIQLGDAMKKILFLALGLSLFLNLYLIDSSVEVVNDFDEKPIERVKKEKSLQDKVILAQSSISKKIQANANLCACPSLDDTDKEVSKAPERKVYDEETAAKKMKQITKDWHKKSHDFLFNELRLREEQIERYKELVLMRKQEADEFFSPKVKRAEENAKLNNEENAYYIHSTEDTVFMGKLAERYDSLLRQNFGDQAFSDYKKFINKYNKEIAKEDFFYPIEF